jgi:hypothetical protein
MTQIRIAGKSGAPCAPSAQASLSPPPLIVARVIVEREAEEEDHHAERGA